MNIFEYMNLRNLIDSIVKSVYKTYLTSYDNIIKEVKKKFVIYITVVFWKVISYPTFITKTKISLPYGRSLSTIIKLPSKTFYI